MPAVQLPINDGDVFKPSGIEYVGAQTITSATTLTNTSPRFNELDSSGGVSFVVFLPAAPYESQTFSFSESAGSATTVTIDGNGKNINGSASLAMSTAYKQRTLRYNGTQWIVIAGLL